MPEPGITVSTGRRCPVSFSCNYNKFRHVLRSILIKAIGWTFLPVTLFLHTNIAVAWSVNANGLYQPGLSDAYSAAELGCSHPNTVTRIALVNFISFEPAAANVVCQSYDETTAQWWYWRA